jgi:hypothetical protein
VILVPTSCLMALVFRYDDVPSDEGGWMLAVPIGLMFAAIFFVVFWRASPRDEPAAADT